ncbi:MAG: hypothetical protein IVW52_05275 [Acidimicrobiales bacterium]|nr:hypothetical protein [Acidimicrobiales bacterium]
MATTTQDLARIAAIRAQLAGRVAGLREGFEELEDALRGALPPATAAPAAAPRSRVLLNRGLEEVLGQLPPIPSSATDLLGYAARVGQRDRSFDIVVPVTAPEPINTTGGSYDAAAIYDAWILNPSVDTRIDFDKAPNQNTPFIAANLFMHFAVRKQKVYYLAVNPASVGTMQVWLLKYAPG